jgi:hypothetical protein
MKNTSVLLIIFLSACSNQSHYKCNGASTIEYLPSMQRYVFEETVGLSISSNKLKINGSKSFVAPLIYSKNGDIKFDKNFELPICSTENLVIESNNYGCNKEILSSLNKKYSLISQITFNKITNQLKYTEYPSKMHYETYSITTAEFDCKAVEVD